MSFYSFYPPVGSGGNASIGTNGAPAPTFSTEVAGINQSNGNLQPLQTDAAGNLLVNINGESGQPFHVIVDSSALPTGASTSANQTTANTSLADIDTNIAARLTGSLVPTAFNEQVLTYVGTTTQISTVTYKLAGTTVKTLTLTYDSNTPPRIIDVVAT